VKHGSEPSGGTYVSGQIQMDLFHPARGRAMIRRAVSDFADDATFLIGAFFARHAILFVALTTIVLVGLARPY
jgi:hypothetical protein